MLIIKQIEKDGIVLTGVFAKEERPALWGAMTKEPVILVYAECSRWHWSKIYKPKGLMIINEEGTKAIESEEDIEGVLAFYYDRVCKDVAKYKMECVEEFV